MGYRFGWRFVTLWRTWTSSLFESKYFFQHFSFPKVLKMYEIKFRHIGMKNWQYIVHKADEQSFTERDKSHFSANFKNFRKPIKMLLIKCFYFFGTLVKCAENAFIHFSPKTVYILTAEKKWRTWKHVI